MSGPLLEVDGLVKHFNLSRGLLDQSRMVRAVDGVSFSLDEGKTLGLVGESGCGKSTVAKLLLRLENPTGGLIRFDGAQVQSVRGEALRRYRRQVQSVFQDPYSSLNPRMRVGDIVGEPLVANATMAGRDIAERVKELLVLVGLGERAVRSFPHEFSGGQRQRIAIARGIALNPKLVVLDEPVSALDVSIRAQILNLLQDIQDRFGTSYLLISHDLDVVAHMCDHIAVMYLGNIVEQGRGEDIRSAPQHPYTKALFSAALPRHPDDQPTRIKLVGELPSPMRPPSGCRFHTRCPAAMPVCSEIVPVRRTLGDGRAVACHLFREETAEQTAA